MFGFIETWRVLFDRPFVEINKFLMSGRHQVSLVDGIGKFVLGV
jgi:hypothetical protein